MSECAMRQFINISENKTRIARENIFQLIELIDFLKAIIKQINFKISIII